MWSLKWWNQRVQTFLNNSLQRIKLCKRIRSTSRLLIDWSRTILGRRKLCSRKNALRSRSKSIDWSKGESNYRKGTKRLEWSMPPRSLISIKDKMSFIVHKKIIDKIAPKILLRDEDLKAALTILTKREELLHQQEADGPITVKKTRSLRMDHNHLCNKLHKDLPKWFQTLWQQR